MEGCSSWFFVFVFARRVHANFVFKADGVVDEASGKGVFEGAQLTFVEAGDGDIDVEITEAKRPGGRLGSDADRKTRGGKAAKAEILRYVLADAAAERNQKQFG